MKNKLILGAAFLLAAITESLACTNLIVGKGASVDGSVIVSYSADSYGMFGELYHYPAGMHEKGTMRDIYDWDSGKYLGQIKEARQTYNVVGNMNEFQVTIGETTFGGREELVDSTGIMDYGSLIYVALQRSRTAKEAIQVMTDLVKEYGYYSSGESFSIADPNEVWILEMIGKGPGVKGAVWVAVRIPDDCIAGVSVDKKTGVTTISVTMQDPRISACLTDTVVNRLQSYIIDYRTNKARKDFHFQEKLFERKKKEYEQAQENYAKFADANKNIILQSYRAEQVRLENEMNLAYQVYTSVAQQLQMAEAKVQEITPVYTVVEPATIPVKASKPNKVMILLGVVFLVGIVCVSWILLGRRFIDTFRGEKYV